MYQAVVARLTGIQPILKADRLVVGTVAGCSVVVGKEHQEGDVGVFFETDGALSDEFCVAMDLYPREVVGDDGTTVRAGGFIDRANRRIRAQTFRGARSEGFWMPLSSLGKWERIAAAVSVLKDGEEFTHLNGVEVCYKYVAKATQQAIRYKGKQVALKKELASFPRHIETGMFAREYKQHLVPGSVVTISEKLHGCVSGDTEVETLENGTVQIQDIVNSKTPCHIKSLDHATGEVCYSEVSDFYLLKDDGDWLEIELDNGTILKITDNNPVWLPQLNCYREAANLVIGDALLVDR
jgi:hypothetical protein